MASNTPTTPTPTPQLNTSKNQNKQRFMAIAAVVIVALLAVNAWLLYKYTQADKAQEKLAVELDETNALQEELNEKYYEARAELESMRTGNAELNALIEQQQEELKAAKDRIASLLRSNGNLDEARSELTKLRQKAESYMAELNQLRAENELLSEENTQLTQERDNLSSDLNLQRQANQSLNEQRALLVSEKEQLSNTNQSLSQKVTRASVIKVNELEATGQKLRRSGKAVTRRDAGNVDRIEVCFNTTVNEIAETGREVFHLRIVNSQGETLALDQMGSGTFVNNATGQTTRFTLADEMDYDGTLGRACMIWAPGQQFAPGNYTIEIYNKGFLAGTTKLKLR